jgi:hypothetical protein
MLPRFSRAHRRPAISIVVRCRPVLESLENRLAPSAAALNQTASVLVAALQPVQSHVDAAIPVVAVTSAANVPPPVTLINVNTPTMQVPPDRTFIALPPEPVGTRPVESPIGNVIINQTGATEPAQPGPESPVVPATSPPDKGPPEKGRSDKPDACTGISLSRAEPRPVVAPRSAFYPATLAEVCDDVKAPAPPQILRAEPAPQASLPLLVWIVGITWLLMLRWQAAHLFLSARRGPRALDDKVVDRRLLLFLLELDREGEHDGQRSRPR